MGGVLSPLRMAADAAAKVLAPSRIVNRNALLLPSMMEQRIAGAKLGLSHVEPDLELMQRLAKALGLSIEDLDKGVSTAPLWMHGQRAMRGSKDIPKTLEDRLTGPLYMTDNPLIATTAEYSTHGPYDEAQRFIWPYIVDPRAVTQVRRSKGEWVAKNNPELTGELEGYNKRNFGYEEMIHALQQASRNMELPSAIEWQGVRDVGPMTYGTGFDTMSQNQLMLYKPRSMVDEGTMLPVFRDGVPYKRGGLAQVTKR